MTLGSKSSILFGWTKTDENIFFPVLSMSVASALSAGMDPLIWELGDMDPGEVRTSSLHQQGTLLLVTTGGT